MFLALQLCQVTMGSDSKIETSDGPSKPDAIGDEEEDPGVNKAHICDFPGCNARFSRPWKLSAHRCTHTGERPYKCLVAGCNKSYTNLTHLRRHEQNQHNADGEKDKKLSEEDKLMCHHYGCYRLFSKKEYLKKHVHRKHNPDKPGVKCTECDETLSDYTRLRWHMVKHDEPTSAKKKQRKTYTCSYSNCPDGPDKVFADYHKLRTHIALAHPSKFECDICKKVFTLRSRLKMHKLSCGIDKNKKQFKCVLEDCNHMFKFRRNMLQHVVHRHGGSRYTCTYEDCGKSFVWKASFKKHLRCHNLENNVVAIIEEVEEDHDNENCDDDKKVEENKKPKKDDVERCRQRKRRKDADIPKQSVAELLSGVEVNNEMKQKLMKKDELDERSDNNTSCLAKQVTDKKDDGSSYK